MTFVFFPDVTWKLNMFITGLDKHFFEHKIVNIFLPIKFKICLGTEKNRLTGLDKHLFWE